MEIKRQIRHTIDFEMDGLYRIEALDGHVDEVDQIGGRVTEVNGRRVLNWAIEFPDKFGELIENIRELGREKIKVCGAKSEESI